MIPQVRVGNQSSKDFWVVERVMLDLKIGM